MEEGNLHNQGRKLLFSELFKGRADDNRLQCKVRTVSDAGNLTITRAGSISSDLWSSGSSLPATTPCSVLGSELSSITTDSEDEGDTDLIDELNRQMADYMLQDDDDDEDGCGGGDCEILLANRENQRILEMEKGFGDFETNSEERKDRLSEWRRNGEEEDGGGKRSQRRNLLQNGSGIKGSGPTNASLGTGVFLPRGITPVPRPSDHRRKKSGCSTVLIPARVLQVLQQHHLANSSIIPNYTHYPFITGYNAMPTTTEVILQHKQPPQQQQQHGEHHLEVSLPKEWIY